MGHGRLPKEKRNTINNPNKNIRSKVDEGMAKGRFEATQLYGQAPQETGMQVQDIIKRRRSRLEGNDPSATRLRESRNRQIRMARAQDASPEELAQIRRSAESDIAYEDFSRTGKALSDYQRLVGNILSGQQSTQFGYGSLEAGKDMPQPPRQSSGGLGTVICTHLYLNGYMDLDTYVKDADYGRSMIAERPHVYLGYRFLAEPVVELMRRSEFFTKIISIPALKWADNMAGNDNLIGKLISKIGEPICSIIGRCLYGQIQSSKVKA